MEILQGPPWRTINFEKIISPAYVIPMPNHLYITVNFFSAQMADTEVLCSCLGGQVKHWRQVGHSQFCRVSKGNGFWMCVCLG